MKNFDLNACGVQEMQQQEMNEVNGGIIGIDDLIIIGIISFMVGCYLGSK